MSREDYTPAVPLDILQAFSEGCEIYAMFRDGKITAEQREGLLGDLYRRYRVECNRNGSGYSVASSNEYAADFGGMQ